MNQATINQTLELPYLKEIVNAESFFFQIAQDKLKEWQDMDLSEEMEEKLLSLHDAYYDLQEEARKDERLERILQLLFEIISYCDTKAKDKHIWNQYEDKRSLARAAVRMQYWIKHLILFKLQRSELDPEGSTTHAFEYLMDPENHTTILSKNHRREMSKNLLGKNYEPGQFVDKLKQYFERFNLSVNNKLNYTYLLASIIYNNDHLWKTDSEEEEEEDIASSVDLEANNEPLNQILYGPPGTGKTYGTITQAVAIIERKAITELEQEHRKEIKRRFDQYRNAGRIGMVTFHQSFSYEDFVEGIKPIMNEEEKDGGGVSYQIEDGIFKTMAESAATLKNLSDNQSNDKPVLSIDDSILNQAEFYKMSLGNTQSPEDDDIYRYCLENNCIALGWGDNIDFSDVENEKQLKEKLKENGIGSDKGYGYTLPAIKCLKFWMKEGEIVFISNGNKSLRAIAQITGDYFFDEATPIAYSQFRPVKWLYTDLDIPVTLVYERNFSQATLYQMYKHLVKKDFFRKKAKSEEGQQTNNSVLIIDEINRANVAAVMGELITLIEKDKRSGEANEVRIQLPYSKTEFSVPSNLYLIGTMNTADRSVEALDTALRRRFSFTEVGPKPELLSPKAMILSLLNREAYADLGWEEEPYQSHARKLYDFLDVAPDRVEAPRREKAEVGEGYWEKSDLEHLSPDDFTGVQLDKLLRTINLRIARLIDRDHMIGHAYFMGIATAPDPWQALKEVFHRNILPLLQEYFFGDYAKIGLVLGSGFVSVEEAQGKGLFADFPYEASADLATQTQYTLKDVSRMSIPDFRKAVWGILPNSNAGQDG